MTTEQQTQGQGKNRTTVDVPVGIHTYWANQDLFFDVKNNCKAGWYRLRMEARNYDGKLPDFYTHFTVMVKNQRTDKWVGGLLIKAADNNYHTGSMLVYLPEGNTRLNLLWNNDAYESGNYDANIDIKDVTINYSSMQQPRGSLVRRANQFSELNGRFFWDKNSVYTYWANQTIGFDFPNLQPGLYQVRVVAKNNGKLPQNYQNFNVEVDTNNGTSAVMQIPADDRNYRAGTVNLDLTGGDTTVYLNWTNDQYAANQYDANIQIKTIRLIRIGDSQRSALAAYLIAKARSNKGIIMILGGMVIVLSGLFVWNRKRMRAGASY